MAAGLTLAGTGFAVAGLALQSPTATAVDTPDAREAIQVCELWILRKSPMDAKFSGIAAYREPPTHYRVEGVIDATTSAGTMQGRWVCEAWPLIGGDTNWIPDWISVSPFPQGSAR